MSVDRPYKTGDLSFSHPLTSADRRIIGILDYLTQFINKKQKCRVILTLDFSDGNVRQCKKQVEDSFNFDSFNLEG